MGCPIRKFPDQSLFAAPRDLSQRTTSFIASQRQGIRRIPFRHLIVLEIRKRTTRLSPSRARPEPHFEPASADELDCAFRLSKRPVLLQTHPGSLRSGSDHDWYACRMTEYRKQRTDRSAVRRLTSVIRYRMRFLFTMSSCQRTEGRRRRTDCPRSCDRLSRRSRLAPGPQPSRKITNFKLFTSSERRPRGDLSIGYKPDRETFFRPPPSVLRRPSSVI